MPSKCFSYSASLSIFLRSSLDLIPFRICQYCCCCFFFCFFFVLLVSWLVVSLVGCCFLFLFVVFFCQFYCKTSFGYPLIHFFSLYFLLTYYCHSAILIIVYTNKLTHRISSSKVYNECNGKQNMQMVPHFR